ncbi:MAG: toprim domain-containing protein [Shewanella sp.]
MSKTDISAEQILQRYASAFIATAAEAGIDGAALLERLPPSGTLLTGRRVPVIAPRYRGTCSVLFYINPFAQGGSWPYAQFQTFKDGGITTTFHGLQLWRSACQVAPVKSVVIGHAQPQSAAMADDDWRLSKVKNLLAHYYRAKILQADHPWLQRRLLGMANDSLLLRVDGRCTAHNQMLFGLSHSDRGLVGYHQITPTRVGDEKRHYIQAAGLLTGSAVRIRPHRFGNTSPIALCEGLITGLTIALCWSGPVVVALCANNLAAVRATLPEPVCFFADNDQWKPEVGNVGIKAARQAARPGDRVVWPLFPAEFHHLKPTDYNDVLTLLGQDPLARQIALARGTTRTIN